MSDIVITFVEKTQNRNLNPPATGSAVAAWAVAKFVQHPADGTYPTTQTPDATGTTDSSGSVTLTGLTSSDSYYVSIVDAAGMPHWTQPLIAGSGAANKLTYVPAPLASTTPTSTLTQVGGRIYRSTNQTGLSSPTPFLPENTDYLDGVTTDSDPDSGAAGLQVITAGLYVVSVNLLLTVTSGGGATPGNCQLLVSGGDYDIAVSTYADGVHPGTTTLQFTDIWSLEADALVYARVDTPDDAAYAILGGGEAVFGLSSLAIAYAGGTLS